MSLFIAPLKWLVKCLYQILSKLVFDKMWLSISLILLTLILSIFLLPVYKYNALNYGGPLQALAIPPLIDSRQSSRPIIITAARAEHEFVPGIASDTNGYNGTYLGPTVRMYRGEDTHIRFINELGEATNVHGHGLHVSGDKDGGESTVIHDGEAWDVVIPVDQQASTNWYHPHLMHTTGKQVHSGLAGFYLIEDDNSQSLNLPNDYGVNDIPLVVQDRHFRDGKMLPYPDEQTEDSGYQSTFVINGTVNPELKVPAGLVRLRLLNGANARSFEFYFADNRPFYKIATEGGLLESPVEINKIRMAPGERNEIVADFSDGQSIAMMGKFLWPEYDELTAFFSPRARLIQITVDAALPNPASELKAKLNTIEWYHPKDVLKVREFELDDDMSINGEQMNMKKINFTVNKGDLEQWNITSGEHPFHMHGVSFQILSRNGKPPAPEDRGWKDTILPLGNAQLLMRFHHLAPKEYPYMYHCHILEHEDMGMMGQFVVQ